jgi:hypothetical protein
MRYVHGLRRSPRNALGGEGHVDVAAIIARSLNRAPAPEAAPPLELIEPEVLRVPPISLLEDTIEIEPITEPITEPVAEQGLIARFPLRAPLGEDPLVDELVSLGMSLIYDLTAGGPVRWDQIVVELPPDEDAIVLASLAGTTGPVELSIHSRGSLDVIRAQLDDVDPGCGYDLVVRRTEVIVCRWPSRASDVRDPEPVASPPPAEPEPVPPQHEKKRSKFRRKT